MCGIVGLLGSRPDGDLRVRLEAMVARLAHRGPDDVGFWHDPSKRVGLAHARLAVIDLTPTGAQPMVSSDGRYHLVTNGEIYNFRGLRDRLEDRGHSFRGESDTEVMLAAFMEWGLERALESFDGMFAFALWDAERRVLHLVRDRMGEKPLYYGRVGGRFAFSSELRSLGAIPGFDRLIDREALAELVELGYVAAPRSIYRSVAKLPAGGRLTVDDRGDIQGPTTWWDPSEVAERGLRSPLEASEAQALQLVEERLTESIRRRLVADVPVGAFLSGGVDSSLVVSLMQRLTPKPVRTFSVGFRDPAYDESSFARAVAQHLGTEHTEILLEADAALAVLPELPEIYDEPFADPSQIPTVLVSRLARRDVTVVLTGDGGDELFGGYRRYRTGRRLWRAIAPLPGPVRNAAARILRASSSLARERSGFRLPGRCQRLAELLGSRSADDIYRLLVAHCPDGAEAVIGAEPSSRRLDRSGLRTDDWMLRWMCIDQRTYLPEKVLVKVDRGSMRVALECRSPFLDSELIDLAWRLPSNLKVRGGTGKWILRRLLERYAPQEIAWRGKAGFELPLGPWLRGRLRGWAEDLLARERLEAEGFFRVDVVRRRWREHLHGRRDWRFFLWSVLMFQSWHEARGTFPPGPR